MTDKKQKRKSTLDLSTMVYGKVPPQAKDLEEAVLGAIMLESGVFDTVCSILQPECFYVEAHQRIYRAMQRLYQKSQPTEILMVIEELKTSEDLDIIGGPYFIVRLTNRVVSAANVEAYSRIIIQKFIARELIRISGETISAAYEDSSDVFEVLDYHEGQVMELHSTHSGKTSRHVSELVGARVERIEALRKAKRFVTGVHSGYNDLDTLTHGWQPTDLIILAARPSVGKTALALNLARNAALHPEEPVPTAFFSLEMSSGQLIDRLLASESEIWLEKVTNGQLDDAQMKILYSRGVDNIQRAPLFIDDTAALNIFELRAKMRRLKAKHNIGFVIIDYLQLMSGLNEKHSTRENEISKISRDLKGIAKELQIPIIALSQLSRKTEERKGEAKMPQLSDLRESGAIEQDADMVMFLYRPEYYDASASEVGDITKGETHVRIAKHRNGKLDTVKLIADLGIQKFTSWESNLFSGQLPSSTSGWKPVQKDTADLWDGNSKI